MRIAVFGTGGAGGYFGAQLARAGEDVIFIARGEHAQAIRAQGLRVETPKGELVIRPARASDNPAEVGDVDAVIVGVKAWQGTDAAHAMQPMVGPETSVIPLQNGVEVASHLAAVLGDEHVLVGLCGTISWVVRPGHIRSIGETHFVQFGELDKRPGKRAERLRQAFARARVKVEISTDIHVALWEKFLFVVSWGGIGALARKPVGVTRTVPEMRQMIEQCMREIFVVARAHQIACQMESLRNQWRLWIRLHPVARHRCKEILLAASHLNLMPGMGLWCDLVRS
jgi:2-dehydropantoate 2-reductase